MKSASLMSFSSEFSYKIGKRSNLGLRRGRFKEVVGQPFEVNLNFMVLLLLIGWERVLSDRKRVCVSG